jgi:hypothetical protein
MLESFERAGYNADIAGPEREFGRRLTKSPEGHAVAWDEMDAKTTQPSLKLRYTVRVSLLKAQLDREVSLTAHSRGAERSPIQLRLHLCSIGCSGFRWFARRRTAPMITHKDEMALWTIAGRVGFSKSTRE